MLHITPQPCKMVPQDDPVSLRCDIIHKSRTNHSLPLKGGEARLKYSYQMTSLRKSARGIMRPFPSAPSRTLPIAMPSRLSGCV